MNKELKSNLRDFHELKEACKKASEVFAYLELDAIPHCEFYSYDDGAFEEYCNCEEIVRTKDFESVKECWQCKFRSEAEK